MASDVRGSSAAPAMLAWLRTDGGYDGFAA
jgi:hypothetical protein